MFYDDYSTLFNPRAKKTAPLDAATALSRLWAAASARGYDLNEWAVSREDTQRVRDVIARAMAAPAPVAAPARALADARAAERDAKAREKAVEAERKKRETEAARALAREQAEASRAQARVEKERSTRAPVAAEDVAPKVLVGFLKDSMKDAAARYVVVAQRVEDETWIGVVQSGGEYQYAVAVRIPGTIQGVRYTLRGCKLGSAEPVLKGLTSYANVENLLTEDVSASNTAAWEELVTAWQDRDSWTLTNLSRSARTITDFASEVGGRYGLDAVVWDDVSSGISAPAVVRQRLMSDAPLHGYDGAFGATDGSRLALLGVERAPAGGIVTFPRAMLDYCDPREALGKRYARRASAAAIGPFVFHGHYADFPDYRQVLPRLQGLAFTFNVAQMEAVAPYYPLAGLREGALTSHATLLTRSDGTTGDIAVRYVPANGDSCDYEAFPARFVMQDAIVHDCGATKESNEPRYFRATFLHDAFSAIRAGGEQGAVLLLSGNALSPSAILTPAQMHIIMPIRDDSHGKTARETFASADREASQPHADPDTAGTFTHYPEAVAFSVTGTSYHNLFREIVSEVKPSNVRVFAFPVTGPSGYETWIIPAGTDTAMRLPGAKIDRAYDANDESKTKALMVQIFTAKRTLPERLSPGCPGGTLPELTSAAAMRVLEPVSDRTLTASERVVVPPAVAASALRFLPEGPDKFARAAYLTQDGTMLATDGFRIFIAPEAVPDMQTVDVGAGFVAVPAPVLYEIGEGAEELYIGTTALAAGRVVAKRPKRKPPDLLTVVDAARSFTPEAVYVVTNLDGFIRALTNAAKGQKFPTVHFPPGEPVALGFSGATVGANIVHVDTDTEGRVDAGLNMLYLADALASVRDSGRKTARIVIRASSDATVPIAVESEDATEPFSMISRMRLE